MKGITIVIFIFLFIQSNYALGTVYTVPERMQFCGIDLQLSLQARQEIQKTVEKLTHKSEYLQTLQLRCDLYMPWVEAALKQAGVPEDLKYLVIQESAFIGDAVSSSNAVGFWQFKDFTAREVGLVVNNQIDERKHIYKSTIAAARYFYQNNRIFDNYLYAVVAYYTGGGGSMAYIDPKHFGARSMQIGGDFHWYPLKALAHKIVFEQYIAEGNAPQVWLQAEPIMGPLSLQAISSRYQVHADTFKKYNLWMLQDMIPGDGKAHTIFLPGETEVAAAGVPVHNGLRPEIRPSWAGAEIPVPSIVQQNQKMRTSYRTVYMLWDEDFVSEYIYVKTSADISQFTNQMGLSVEELQRFNPELEHDVVIQAGQWLRTTDPKHARYHIVKQGDTWSSISSQTGVSLDKLYAYNRERDQNSALATGLKVHLRKRIKGKGNRVILQPNPSVQRGAIPVIRMKHTGEDSIPGQSGGYAIVCEPVRKTVVCKVLLPESLPAFPQMRGRWITHDVKRGDEIWLLARKYDTRGDLIRKINQLSSSRIKPGMQLRIFHVTPI